jgi:hypothetical protein
MHLPHRLYRTIFLLCLIAVHAKAMPNNEAPENVIPDFQQLALNLQKTPRSIRADFAIAAITEAIALHRRETGSGRLHSDSGKLEHWASSVDDYTRQLSVLVKSITPTTSVRIRQGQDSRIQLQLNSQVVIISSPRVNQQALLEQTITQHFCSQYPCDSLIEGYASRRSERVDTLPHWQFTLSPVASCNSGDGLELLFSNNDKLLKKRNICKQLFRELTLLAAALAERETKGFKVEWYQLEIHSSKNGGNNVVRFNAQSDTLQLAIPACASSPGLIKRILPWLVSKADGQGYQGILLVVTNTEELIAELL